MFLINEFSRRDFLKLSVAIAILSIAPPQLQAIEEITNLSLYVQRDGCQYNVNFVQNGALIEDKYIDLCTIFKDKNADVAVKMDPNLFVTLALGQRWLAQYGYNGPLILTSGYRTKFTNMMTEGSAEDSMHIYGKAADIKYPGLPIMYLAQIFRSFGATGIGIYSNFIHVDTWKTRVWHG